MSGNKKNLIKTIFTAKSACGCGRSKPSDVHEPKPKPKRSISQNPPNPSHYSLSSISNDRKNENKSLSATMDVNEDFSFTTQSFNMNDTSSPLNSESESTDHHPRISTRTLMLSPCPKIVDSIAVEQDSNDPYQDFYHSMVAMITEKEIYSNEDLQELLKCFLELNSATHHDIIVQAFMEICNEFISKSSVSYES